MAMIKLVRLFLFAAIPLAMGWAAARYFVDPTYLVLIGSQALYVSFLYTIPSAYSFKVVASIRSLIGHKALSAEKNALLGKIVRTEQNKIFRLFAFYILSALVTVAWRILSSHEEYMALSYVSAVLSTALLSFSILTMFNLMELDGHVTDLITAFSTEERRAEELAKERERQLKALELLSKEDEFSAEEKIYFERARTVRNEHT